MIIFSCNPSTTIDLPKNPLRLTLNCIGANGNPWKARVTLSMGILEFPNFAPVQNATVNIYENGSLMETLTNGNFLSIKDSGPPVDCNYGSINFFPVPGNTYRIEVKAALYETISATYIQPLKVELDTLEVTILGPNPSYQYSKNIQFKVTFIDPPEENFYQLMIKAQSEDSLFPQAGAEFGLSFSDPAYKETNDIFYQRYYPIAFTDSYFNGKKTSLDFESIISQYPDSPPLNYYTVYINHISKDYYNYLKTFYLQDINLDDPFAQPVQVENNVQNGFGIFAGYTQTVKTFKVKN